MNLLIIDTETTALDPQTGCAIELGAILYSVEHQTSLHHIATLLAAPDNSAEHINRIPAAVLPAIAPRLQSFALQTFWEMVQQSDYAIAHNAEFDAQWFGQGCLPMLEKDGIPLRWLCTATDFTWPHQTRPSEALVSLALAHGIGVGLAHRALADCQLISAFFDRMEDLPEMIAHALRPRAIYKALVGYDNRQLAKDAGFRWNHFVQGAWTRKMTEDEVVDLPFHVQKVRDA